MAHTGPGQDWDGLPKSENCFIFFHNTKIDFRGFTDFAGSAVVHLAGAVLSLPGCVILGARYDTQIILASYSQTRILSGGPSDLLTSSLDSVIG